MLEEGIKHYINLEFVFNDTDFNRGNVPHLQILWMGDVVLSLLCFNDNCSISNCWLQWQSPRSGTLIVTPLFTMSNIGIPEWKTCLLLISITQLVDVIIMIWNDIKAWSMYGFT